MLSPSAIEKHPHSHGRLVGARPRRSHIHGAFRRDYGRLYRGDENENYTEVVSAGSGASTHTLG